jgi:anti-sigma B factor antagonist
VELEDQPDVIVTANLDDPSAPVIALAGELDRATATPTRAAVDGYVTDQTTRVTFDLEKLTFMDSSGIALLVQVSNQVGRVELVHVAPIVHRVLEATGLLEHFGLAP